MNRVVKVPTDNDGGIPVDEVEKLLNNAAEGHKLAVFTDDGTIIFCDSELADFYEGTPEAS